MKVSMLNKLKSQQIVIDPEEMVAEIRLNGETMGRVQEADTQAGYIIQYLDGNLVQSVGEVEIIFSSLSHRFSHA